MIKKRWLGLLLVIYLVAGSLIGLKLVNGLSSAPPDLSAINRIMKEGILGFSNGEFHVPDQNKYDYAILDTSGTVLFQTKENIPMTQEATIKSRGVVIDLADEYSTYGKALIDLNYNTTLSNIRTRLIWSFAAMTLFLLAPFLGYTVYINQRISIPFQRLRAFASYVAAGNLDFPLPMDKGHVFGAFTESFDIMREQLREAKLKENQANQSKKELVASLSHDIKTPVASIKLISELLLVTEDRPATKQKLDIIYQKSEQINHLITNMLHASLEDLGELNVNPRDESSQVLEGIIDKEDYYQKTKILPIPGCILMMDVFRMEQIIGNIINNSYKYADTDITVVSQLQEDGLLVEFRDYGKGVPEEELPYLLNKFYRGNSNKESADGSGLGLYISRHLMEQSGGMIDCFNRDDGFSVVLFIPFALPAT